MSKPQSDGGDTVTQLETRTPDPLRPRESPALLRRDDYRRLFESAANAAAGRRILYAAMEAVRDSSTHAAAIELASNALALVDAEPDA